MVQFKRILVPIDFSEYSRKALRYAVELAGISGGELLIVYVIEPVGYPADLGFGQVAFAQAEIDLEERSKTQLERVAQEDVEGKTPTTVFIRHGKPFVEIIQLAREENIDLIVIATHGHSAIEHALFGSTAEKVVRKAPCPVLSIRDEAMKFSMP